MYTCTICHSLNHASRFHCSVCGTVPAMYSVQGDTFNCLTGINVVAAHGAQRNEHKPQRLQLRTVQLDYYASE